MYLEMREGRGINGKRYIYLDMRPETVNKYAAEDGRCARMARLYRVPAEELLSKLPDIVDFSRTYLGVDPVAQPMPVQPTAHYAMGGIPTNKYGEVVIDANNTGDAGAVRRGRVRLRFGAWRQPPGDKFTAGSDCVWQAYRLPGCRICSQGASFPVLPADPTEFVRQEIEAISTAQGDEKVLDIAREMKAVMFEDVGVFRTQEGMENALAKVREMQERLKHVQPRRSRQDFQYRADECMGD